MLLSGFAACFLLVVLMRPSAFPPAPRRACMTEEKCKRWLKEGDLSADLSSYTLIANDSPDWYAKDNEIIYFNNIPNNPNQDKDLRELKVGDRIEVNYMHYPQGWYPATYKGEDKTRGNYLVTYDAATRRNNPGQEYGVLKENVRRPIAVDDKRNWNYMGCSYCSGHEFSVGDNATVKGSKFMITGVPTDKEPSVTQYKAIVYTSLCQECKEKDFASSPPCDKCNCHVEKFEKSDLEKSPELTPEVTMTVKGKRTQFRDLCTACVGTGRPAEWLGQETWKEDLENLKKHLKQLPIKWDNVFFRQSYSRPGRREHANVTIELWEHGNPTRHYLRFGKHVRYDRGYVIEGRNPVISMLIHYLKTPKGVPCEQCRGQMKVCMQTGRDRKKCPKYLHRCNTKPCPTCFVPSDIHSHKFNERPLQLTMVDVNDHAGMLLEPVNRVLVTEMSNPECLEKGIIAGSLLLSVDGVPASTWKQVKNAKTPIKISFQTGKCTGLLSGLGCSYIQQPHPATSSSSSSSP